MENQEPTTKESAENKRHSAQISVRNLIETFE
jgi:hypothetical protein